MLRYSKFIIFIAFLLINGITFCQYNSNSIFSQYGLGDLAETGLVQNRALGGIAIGLRQPNQINYLNPASYNSQDSMSFLWDIGMNYNLNTLEDISGTSGKTSINFDHIAVAFPVSKWNFVSAGIVPLSDVGYKGLEQQQADQEVVNSSYSGSGKLNRFFLGQACGFFKNHLNAGINVSYIFGSLNKKESIEYIDNYSYYKGMPNYFNVNTYWEEKNVDNGIEFSLGLQGTEQISKGIKLTGGLTFNPKNTLKINFVNSLYRFPENMKELNNIPKSIDTTVSLSVPARIGIGGSVLIKEKLMIGVDIITQDWSGTRFINQDESFKRNNYYRLGLQYSPNSTSGRNYFAKMSYRAGGYYNETYLIYKGKPLVNYGITIGAGLPFINSGSMFNFAIEFGRYGAKSESIPNFSYTHISLGLTLYDFWFGKRK